MQRWRFYFVIILAMLENFLSLFILIVRNILMIQLKKLRNLNDHKEEKEFYDTYDAKVLNLIITTIQALLNFKIVISNAPNHPRPTH